MKDIRCLSGLHEFYHVHEFSKHKMICARCKKIKTCKKCGSDNIQLLCGLGECWTKCLNCEKLEGEKIQNLTDEAFKENED